MQLAMYRILVVGTVALGLAVQCLAAQDDLEAAKRKVAELEAKLSKLQAEAAAVDKELTDARSHLTAFVEATRRETKTYESAVEMLRNLPRELQPNPVTGWTAADAEKAKEWRLPMSRGNGSKPTFLSTRYPWLRTGEVLSWGIHRGQSPALASGESNSACGYAHCPTSRGRSLSTCGRRLARVHSTCSAMTISPQERSESERCRQCGSAERSSGWTCTGTGSSRTGQHLAEGLDIEGRDDLRIQ